jgi:diaminopropionate ammonia-lyase
MQHVGGAERLSKSAGRPSRFWINPLPHAGRPTAIEAPDRDPLQFARRLPGYQPTPLVDLKRTAADLGLNSLHLKDESARLGLPAFKVLGAWWAAYRLLSQRLGREPLEWRTLADLAAAFAPLRPLTLCAATDGSHGRAVARFARLMGFDALVFVPAFVAAPRVAAIRSEGARVETVEGIFEDALHAAAAAASERCLLVSDDSWPGYTEVPGWVIDGYSTLFWEIDDELSAAGQPGPDVVLVQMGVGALAAATVRHYRRAEARPQPTIIGVEPLSAACVLESLAAGEMREVPGPHSSLMANLNCGMVSMIALPILLEGMSASVAIDDAWAIEGMRGLAREGVQAGVTGVAGFAGLLAVLGERSALREQAFARPQRVLVICTEGRAADPGGYDRLVGGEAAGG